VIDLVAEMFQRAAQEIDRDNGAEIPDMPKAVNGRPADVEADAFPAGSSGRSGTTARLIVS
jgi:hypothetical protein